MLSSSRRDRLTTTVLSWVAGYVDTAGFLSLKGLFTAHVTGNLVVVVAELAGVGDRAVWVRLAVISVFIGAVLLTTVIASALTCFTIGTTVGAFISEIGLLSIGLPVGAIAILALTVQTGEKVGVSS